MKTKLFTIIVFVWILILVVISIVYSQETNKRGQEYIEMTEGVFKGYLSTKDIQDAMAVGHYRSNGTYIFYFITPKFVELDSSKKEIKYRCPNGCEDDIFYKIYSVPMSAGEKWIKLSPKGETIAYDYPYICYFCKGIFSENQLLATAKAYKDSLANAECDSVIIGFQADDSGLYPYYWEYNFMDGVKSKFNSLEKRIAELEKLLEGKILLEENGEELRWVPIIRKKQRNIKED